MKHTTAPAPAGGRVFGRLRMRGERGVVGGAEGLLFGVLILVAGTLVLVSAWAVLDRRTALDAAAREYLRSYTEQQDIVTAGTAGRAAAIEVLRARGTDPGAVDITTGTTNGFGPCATASVQLTSSVRWLHAPFIDSASGTGDTTVRVTHRELIDAHREVTPSADYDPDATLCAQN